MRYIQRIKQIQEKNYFGIPWDKIDTEFLESCLKDKTSSQDEYIAALLAFSEADEAELRYFLTIYSELTYSVQSLAIPLILCSDEPLVITSLLRRLKVSDNMDEVEVIIYSMAESHMVIAPFIVEELIDDDEVYVGRLKGLLKMMGIQKLRPFLIMSPTVPHEAVFRSLFGNAVIDHIKQRK